MTRRKIERETGRSGGGGGAVLRALMIGGALAALGCTGAINGDAPGKTGGGGANPPPSTGGGMNPGMDPTGGGGGGTTPGPTPVMPGSVNVGISPLRRLTSDQYRNTVRDLLLMKDARDVVQATLLPSDDSIVDRFTSNTVSSVQGLDADKYADTAEMLARKAVMNLPGLLTCDTKAMGEPACATQFIRNFGKRAFRRPLTDAEVARYQKVYMAGGQFSNGIRLVIQTFLQSPKFLYLVEPVPAGDAGKVLAVDGWVMASRLSYFFLNSMPDDALLAAAEAGQLSTPEQVGQQAARLLADPRFTDTSGFFHNEWLELDGVLSADKDPKLFPTWNDDVKAALNEQMRRFVDDAMRGDGKLETLLTSTSTFLSGPLYDLYGVPKPAGAAANTWQKVSLDPKQRSGLLTHAGLLAGLAHEDRTSFILRGKLVREALLCVQVGSPPPGVDANETNIPPTATAKQRSEMHRTKPECAACHALFDPLGFGFEIYDAAGRYRSMDGMGAPIDSAVDITATRGIDGHVANALELVQRLAGADEVRDCVARQWLRFGLGRTEDDTADASTLAAALKSMKDSGGKIPDLLVTLARSDAFRHQKVKP
jgi:hypothetical protein